MIEEPGRPAAGIAVLEAPTPWTDPASGLPGAAFWRVVLPAESARCVRYRRQSTVVFAQLVLSQEMLGFGGRALVLAGALAVGVVLRSGSRTCDFIARLDDARFGLILPETDEVAAVNMVERVRDECDAALRQRTIGGRVAFGWAGTDPSRPLLMAADLAEERLRRDIVGVT
jgi:hypothetical protein